MVYQHVVLVIKPRSLGPRSPVDIVYNENLKLKLNDSIKLSTEKIDKNGGTVQNTTIYNKKIVAKK